ncbi:MAG: acyl-CoA dehydrogenase family protein [Crocosphaera sp.]|nr:acyl-CoA dehydrogenase family protein [Crocosphaera sp.]
MSLLESELVQDSEQSTKQVINWLRDYAPRRINSQLIDQRRSITPHIVLDFGKQGLLGMIVPKSDGGLGLSYSQMFQIMKQVAAIDLNLALFVGLSNVLGIYPILKYGNKSQKQRYLSSLAQGRELAAFALTEPGAGSNPRKIKAQATPKGNGEWLLSGTKLWSGSASWSSVINVFANIVEEKGKLPKVTAFTIPEDAKGLRQGPEALTMGMRGMVQNAIYLEQVPVTHDHILGEIGSGFEIAQDAMQLGRLTIAATCVGGMQRCAQLMLRYASRRSIDMIGKDKLVDKYITLIRLSDITAAITAVECLVNIITRWLDEGTPVPQEAYLTAKVIPPELMWQTADNLVQLLGGRGYIEPNLAPQILRDARILRIFEGPTETVRNYLGLLSLYHTSNLCKSFNDLLDASDISTQLEKTAKSCLEKVNRKDLSQNDKKMLREVFSEKLGDLAAWGFMLACVQKCYQSEPTDEIQRSQMWVKQQFEKKLTNVLEQSVENMTLLNAAQINTLINNYVEEIGDIESTLPGEDHQLDTYLLQDLTNKDL